MALNVMFTDHTIHPQFRIKDTHRTYIVDYFVESNTRRIAIEFDGPTHYCSTKTQLRDIDLELYCKNNHIQLVRIPYFIQLDDRTIFTLFGKDVYTEMNLLNKISSEYPNGFIDKKIVYPSDFNTYGWRLFIKQYINLIACNQHSCAKEIYDSVCNDEITLKLGVHWESDPSKYAFVRHKLCSM